MTRCPKCGHCEGDSAACDFTVLQPIGVSLGFYLDPAEAQARGGGAAGRRDHPSDIAADRRRGGDVHRWSPEAFPRRDLS